MSAPPSDRHGNDVTGTQFLCDGGDAPVVGLDYADPTAVFLQHFGVAPWRHTVSDQDQPSRVDANFFRGLWFGLPMSAILWGLIYAAYRIIHT